LIGVDTPETVDPRRPVGCFGKEASNESHRLMDNQSVVLVKDVTDKDKYDRLLRYVYVIQDQDNWLFINDYLVRNGFAKSSTYPPDVKYQEQFKEAEIEAREAKRGLWGEKCSS
jgi:micrococcal nuclease